MNKTCRNCLHYGVCYIRRDVDKVIEGVTLNNMEEAIRKLGEVFGEHCESFEEKGKVGKRCESVGPVKGGRCVLLKGHEGDHNSLDLHLCADEFWKKWSP